MHIWFISNLSLFLKKKEENIHIVLKACPPKHTKPQVWEFDMRYVSLSWPAEGICFRALENLLGCQRKEGYMMALQLGLKKL